MPGSEFSVRTESPLRTPRRPCACTRRHPVGEHDAESSPPSPPRRCTPAHAASRGAPPRHRVRQTTTGRRASVSGKINHGTTESDRHLRDAAVRRDMTEPKVLEDALRRSEEMYRVLFQKNPNPVWVCDAETLRILAVNEGAMRVYGYAREEFLGLTLADLHVSDDVPSLLEHASSPQPELVDAGVWRHRKKGGTIIDVELVSQEILVEGTRALLVMAIDVTDRRRAEEALRRSEYLYRTVASNIPSGTVGLFDRALRYIVVDGAGVLDAAGVSKEALVGKTIGEVLPADTWALLEPLCRGALEGHTANGEVPSRGRTYFIQALAMPGDRERVVE